ncbi:hypothetical protein HYQ45_018535 [Verticillium longisporum]|uniref:Secreted protein n=1 Tax=Verticillium longisporum TaxID=100787 RepID=A0A8I2Z278_VERLO|nr:hypothetical protein HYQ45_018535 [Verticillium longisporum]
MWWSWWSNDLLPATLALLSLCPGTSFDRPVFQDPDDNDDDLDYDFRTLPLAYHIHQTTTSSSSRCPVSPWNPSQPTMCEFSARTPSSRRRSSSRSSP